MVLLITLGLILWWIVGFIGFVYWWTSDFDLRTSDLMMGFIVACLGPFTWIMGPSIHDPDSLKVLIKRRKRNVHI